MYNKFVTYLFPFFFFFLKEGAEKHEVRDQRHVERKPPRREGPLSLESGQIIVSTLVFW